MRLCMVPVSIFVGVLFTTDLVNKIYIYTSSIILFHFEIHILSIVLSKYVIIFGNIT